MIRLDKNKKLDMQNKFVAKLYWSEISEANQDVIEEDVDVIKDGNTIRILRVAHPTLELSINNVVEIGNTIVHQYNHFDDEWDCYSTNTIILVQTKN